MLKIFAIVMCSYLPNGYEQCQPITQSTFTTLEECETDFRANHFPRVIPQDKTGVFPPVGNSPAAEIFCAESAVSVWQRAK